MNTSIEAAQQTILVVDDTPTNIQVLFDLLDSSGYRVAIAKSGEIALKRLEQSLPDLILLDVMMPGIDGFETCIQIKADERKKDIPIIFMTALSDPLDKVKGLNIGAVDYITKPIQNEEVLARIKVHLQLRQLNQTLESQVEARTAELQQALQTVQQAQLQLVQSEKLSSLGQLVAGIAHEINNPINFIYGNLKPAETYTQDLLELIHCYQEQVPNPPEAIQALAEEIDLEFLQEDLPKLVDSMKLGADRIRQIVLSLRNFSRLDDAIAKATNIHEGLDSTLLILHHRFKSGDFNLPAIKLDKQYGQLPLVECYASQLNQVFMNLISNAIDALNEVTPNQYAQDHGFVPTITIRTEQRSPTTATIRIQDNGSGMPESVRQKIFEAFFTTKAIGAGTGLGLSISQQIICDRHHGTLTCQSTPGKGTEFIIDLPIRQPLDTPASKLEVAMT